MTAGKVLTFGNVVVKNEIIMSAQNRSENKNLPPETILNSVKYLSFKCKNINKALGIGKKSNC